MTIQLAVIGVGSLGQHHARLAGSLPGIALAGIVDTHRKRADHIARKLHTRGYTNYQSLLGQIDAAIIAVPTDKHYEVAHDMLSCGIHCLVEKPITDTLEQAENLVALAAEKNLILQIGHIERFNPAVIKAQDFIDRPMFIEANRLGPFDPRTDHIGVVMDLMIHDLDIILTLVNSSVESMESFGASLLSRHEDIAKVRLRFSNGCIADISSSRISLERFRKIRIFQQDSYITLDYMKPSLKIYRKKNQNIKSLRDLEIITPKLKKQDSLKSEIEHFVTCITSGNKPRVSGKHGRDALELAIEILKNIQNRLPS